MFCVHLREMCIPLVLGGGFYAVSWAQEVCNAVVLCFLVELLSGCSVDLAFNKILLATLR